MELRPGYKQSDVGVIPDDWDAVPLSQTAKRITRGASPRPIDSPVWFDSRSSVGWVRISDVTRSGRYLMETTQRLSKEGIRRSRPVPSGSLIMSICATVGRPIETRIDTCIHDGFVVFDQPSIDQSYLYHVLAALEPAWSKHGQTGSQMNLNTGLINGCLIPLPPAETEQRAIAQALSDVDTLLATLDQMIAKKRDLKQAAMQQLLTGKTRLPGFSGPWDVKQIGEFTDCTAGGTPSTLNSAYWDGEIPWMSSGELHLKRVQDVEGRITKLGLNNSGTKIIPSRCVLVGLAGQGKTRGTVAINLIELCTNQSIAAIFPNESFNSEYLFHNLDARYDELRELSTGDGGRGGLNLKIIKSIDIPFPSLDEQDAIASALSDLDAELAALEARRDKTRNLKWAMMQELLTGKTRLV
jgi:type I restriction enzyme S subunit